MRLVDLIIPLGEGVPASLSPYTRALAKQGFMVRRMRIVRRADDAGHHLVVEAMLGVVSGERGHVRGLVTALGVDKILAQGGTGPARQFTSDCGDEEDGTPASWFITVDQIAALGGYSPVTMLPGFVKIEQQQL